MFIMQFFKLHLKIKKIKKWIFMEHLFQMKLIVRTQNASMAGLTIILSLDKIQYLDLPMKLWL
jgi:hypothetical protein